MCTDENFERSLVRLVREQGVIPELGFLLLDRSGSMNTVLEPTKKALSQQLKNLKNDSQADRMFISLITFADEATIDIPLTLASDLPSEIPYRPHGLTRLHATVRETLLRARSLEDRFKADDISICITISVITDGGDDDPQDRVTPQRVKEENQLSLERLSREMQKRGHVLQTFGLGRNANLIAKNLGFPTSADRAFSMTKTPEGIQRTMFTSMMRKQGEEMSAAGGHPPRTSSKLH